MYDDIKDRVFLFAASHIFVDARTNQPLKVCSLSFLLCSNLIIIIGVPTSVFTQSFSFKTGMKRVKYLIYCRPKGPTSVLIPAH